MRKYVLSIDKWKVRPNRETWQYTMRMSLGCYLWTQSLWRLRHLSQRLRSLSVPDKYNVRYLLREPRDLNAFDVQSLVKQWQVLPHGGKREHRWVQSPGCMRKGPDLPNCNVHQGSGLLCHVRAEPFHGEVMPSLRRTGWSAGFQATPVFQVGYQG